MTEAERGRLRARVSHDHCAGVGMCKQFAPGAFTLNAAGQAEFHPEGDWTAEALDDAADACPMSAITVDVRDGEGM